MKETRVALEIKGSLEYAEVQLNPELMRKLADIPEIVNIAKSPDSSTLIITVFDDIVAKESLAIKLKSLYQQLGSYSYIVKPVEEDWEDLAAEEIEEILSKEFYGVGVDTRLCIPAPIKIIYNGLGIIPSAGALLKLKRSILNDGLKLRSGTLKRFNVRNGGKGITIEFKDI